MRIRAQKRFGRPGIAAVLALIGAGCFAGCGESHDDAAPEIAYRPYTVLPIERPGEGAIDVADPTVIRVKDTWYLYPTSSGQGFEVWSSTDLSTWTYGGLVWRPTPGTWNDQGHYWAPHVQAAAAGYYLYYTANGRVGVAFSKSPTGPFAEVLDHPLAGGGYGGIGDGVYRSPNYSVGRARDLIRDYEEYAIDAFLLERRDASLTLYVSRLVLRPPGVPMAVIVALPMRDYATPAAAAPTIAFDVEPESWELLTREGPWVIEHDGVLHLTYSGNGFSSVCYAVGDSTATSPLGPFLRRPDNPILHDDPQAAFWGPGHHSIVAGAHGDLLMFFHAKTTNDNADGSRRIRYAPVSFDVAGNLRFDPAPPGDSAPGHNSCMPKTP